LKNLFQKPERVSHELLFQSRDDLGDDNQWKSEREDVDPIDLRLSEAVVDPTFVQCNGLLMI
jgi:hypothetical protein